MGQTKSYPLYRKSAAEIAAMRKGCRLLRAILEEVRAAVVPGVSTMELDKLAKKLILDAGAKPAFLNKYGFPNTLCTSVNEAVVHGVPTRKPLKEGDIVSVDCGLVLDGFYADRAFTAPVGAVSDRVQRLLRITQEALDRGIDAARVGNNIGDIGRAIADYVRAEGCQPTKDYTGHGIGRQLHEEPSVPNEFLSRGIRIEPGLVLAIEPMINLGTGRTRELKDGWTVVTADGEPSAHFEHTVAITADGPEILTASNDEEAARFLHTGNSTDRLAAIKE